VRTANNERTRTWSFPYNFGIEDDLNYNTHNLTQRKVGSPTPQELRDRLERFRIKFDGYEEPTEKSESQPTEKSDNQPTEKSESQPTEKSESQPTEKYMNQLTKKSVNQSEQLKDKLKRFRINVEYEEPTKKFESQPTEKSSSQPTEKSSSQPTEKSSSQPKSTKISECI